MKGRLKKYTALFIVCVLVFALTGCKGKGSGSGDSTPTPIPTSVAPEATPTPTPEGVAPSEYTRTIKFGTWFDYYYDSTHTDIFDNPKMNDPEIAQMRLDKIREIEQKYNVRLEITNLTFEGVQESINTSIMAGTPDFDVYQVDLSFGIPAILNGYGMALESFLPETSDIFNDTPIFRNFKMPGSDESFIFKESHDDYPAYFLAFNMDMINANNLENPQDLWDRGEWTWDKWLEYLKILTKDTDGDGNIDVYGYGGYHSELSDMILMSNNAHIAAGRTEQLTSPETIEALDFLYRLYHVENCARPWDWETGDTWSVNLTPYLDGKLAFWTSAVWIMADFGNSSKTGFEIGIVPFPVGPNGNKETNTMNALVGNWYMIPVGTERPELVYQVMYDFANWYNYDMAYADMTHGPWMENSVETERNKQYVLEINSTPPWFDLGRRSGESMRGFDAVKMIVYGQGDLSNIMTGAQAAAAYKQIVQDYIDVNLK